MGVNPWSALVLAIGLMLIVVGFKGSQDNLIAALTGKPYKESKLK